MECGGKCKAKIDQNCQDRDIPEIFLISSDDEDQNEDLSTKIVEKAGENEVSREFGEDFDGFEENEVDFRTVIIDLCSSSSDEEEVEIIEDMSCFGNGGLAMMVEERKKRKKKRGKKKKKRWLIEEDGERAVDAALGEMPVEMFETMEMEAVETSDNVVLRKLLRGPRYFDPLNDYSETCHNCGEEGHTAGDCAAEKRKKPCFVCGKFGHTAKHCTQVSDCFICKKRGHLPQDCPAKQEGSTHNPKMCLRCGDLGHDMLSCRNDYSPEDLKEIQCYICKSFGHLCCVEIDIGPKEVCCYNCGQSGHTGLGCAKPRGETCGTRSARICYRCGEEGHIARGCSKYAKPSCWMMGGPSAPTQGFSTAGKSWQRGGSLINDQRELSNKKTEENHWQSPVTQVRKEHNLSTSASGGSLSSSQYPSEKKPGFPSSSVSIKPNLHGFSTSRFGNSWHRYERTHKP